MRRILAPSLFAILLASLLLRLPSGMAERAGTLERLDPLLESRRILREEFVRPVDDEAGAVAAVEGYVASLGDRYTQFVPPADEAAFTRSIRGEYVGIGAEVNMVDGRFTIISPMPTSPALAGGLRAGDIVLAVDGESVDGLDSQAIIDRLLGPTGSTVTVAYERDGRPAGDAVITRRPIVSPTVRGLVRAGEGWHWCLEPEAGLRYVRVTQFNGETAAELRAALVPAEGEPFAGLVLDLRDNPGGGLPTAIQVTDLFLDAGVIVRVTPRNGPGDAYSATPGATVAGDVPIVVLVNENSASASEIVAGALQEAGRAVVVGMRTYGKGSVQQLRELETTGGTLKFTVAAWELGSGHRLDRIAGAETWGVDPDPGFAVPVSDREYTNVLLARRTFEGIVQSAAEYGSPPFSAADCRDIDWVRNELGDRQLATAAEVLAERVTTGAWPEREPADSAALARENEIRQLEALRIDLEERREQIDDRLQTLREQAEAAAAAEPAAAAPAAAGGDDGG
jgi:carboxyl-terminal processing protease